MTQPAVHVHISLPLHEVSTHGFPALAQGLVLHECGDVIRDTDSPIRALRFEKVGTWDVEVVAA